jgi:hypothetical protein
MNVDKAFESYFKALHGGLCDRCDGLISVDDPIVRTVENELLCKACATNRLKPIPYPVQTKCGDCDGKLPGHKDWCRRRAS